MKKLLSHFTFIPFIDSFINRKYYATGFGTYIINSFFKRVLGINKKGDYLLHFTSRVNSPENLTVLAGDNKASTYLSLATSGGCYYQAINGIEIGAGTIWSYNCSFISSNHSFSDISKHEKGTKISIGKNVWLGSNCVILPKVNIGEYSIIGAGSVVTKNIPKYSIAAGNPAKVIGRRCELCLEKISTDSNKNLCNKCDK